MNFSAIALTAIGEQQPSLIRYVQPWERPLDQPVRRQVVEEFGFVPAPVLIHSCVEGLFAGSWMILRETTLVGAVPRSVKEAMSLVVSRMNHCPFCEDSHAMALEALRLPEVAPAVASDDWSRINNSHLVRVLAWAKENSKAHESNTPLSNAPFSAQDAPEIIGTLVLFHYLNRVVNVFLDESPLPGPSWVPKWKRMWQWLGGRAFAKLFAQSLMPGASLSFLPEAELAPDLGWATGSPNVAGAFARFDRVLGIGADAMLSDEIRKIVEDRLSGWCGEAPSLDKGWIRKVVAPLPKEAQPLACLALLAAFASCQVTSREIDAARIGGAGDAELVLTVAWAAFAAARRVGSWTKL